MAERGLVILRCGRGSLHPAWREGAAAADWDLQLCPYEAGDRDWPPARPRGAAAGLPPGAPADPRGRAVCVGDRGGAGRRAARSLRRKAEHQGA